MDIIPTLQVWKLRHREVAEGTEGLMGVPEGQRGRYGGWEAKEGGLGGGPTLLAGIQAPSWFSHSAGRQRQLCPQAPRAPASHTCVSSWTRRPLGVRDRGMRKGEKQERGPKMAPGECSPRCCL